ncbi:hypothetical protein PIB30_036798 [Stylosanthes scabra]|uniref:Ubiquitin-like protease family profile domain-containing protein n=1 Tax=Stylosanthes scabra TaxID=79078 RepID=A0ABU6YDR9_9FABA|nr:hypothetical protein [Stylosanthes scabra]
MRAEKEQLKKKSTKRVPSSNSESQTDSEPQYSSSTDGGGDSEYESEETVSEEPPQREIRSKRRNDRAVVGSNAPLNPTQQSVAVAGLPKSDNATLADALKNIRKRKKQQMEDRNTQKNLAKAMRVVKQYKMQEGLRPKLSPLQPDQQPHHAKREDPMPISIEILFETEDPEPCSLTLRPWLQPEAEASTAKGPMDSPEAMITNVVLSINQEEAKPSAQPTHDDNQNQQLGVQCKTPDSLQQHYTTAPTKQELEEREELQRFEWDVYCVPPEILTRIFDTYGTNYLDRKTKLPHLVGQLKGHEDYLELLDRDKLKSHSVLFAPVVFSNHWWLYVLDVDNKEFYIVDSMYSIAPNQQRNKLHRFALRCVEVPKQPNPTDCGVYVMKWMELLDQATLLGCYEFKIRYNLEEWGQDRLDRFRKEIVAKLILSKENTLRVEAMNQANKMGRQTKPSAALKSPYVQVSTVEIEKQR